MTELYLVQCCRELRYSTSQLCTLLGIGKGVIFSISVEWRTESKALEKSSSIKRRPTYLYSSSSRDIFCKRFMSAAVVDPEGLKANWSLNRFLKSACVSMG